MCSCIIVPTCKTGFMFRFHPGVNRLYCPSEEVAKRALLDGLEESQTRVFGLPIRPSFCRAVLSKVNVNYQFLLDPLVYSLFVLVSYCVFDCDAA